MVWRRVLLYRSRRRRSRRGRRRSRKKSRRRRVHLYSADRGTGATAAVVATFSNRHKKEATNT